VREKRKIKAEGWGKDIQISRRKSCRRNSDNKRHDSDDWRKDYMQISFSCSICVPGVGQDGNCADKVRWGGEEECCDVAFPQTFDYTVPDVRSNFGMKTRDEEKGLDLRGEESGDCSGGCEAVCSGEEKPGFWISGSVVC
jgi:hypothetical protein